MTATGVVGGVVFTWLGMVLAISFLEAPLKFRAPGVTLRIGLGIGRIVFRALNGVEAVLALVLLVAVVLGTLPGHVVTGLLVTVAVLVLQLLAIRPVLALLLTGVLALSVAVNAFTGARWLDDRPSRGIRVGLLPGGVSARQQANSGRLGLG